MTKLVVQASVLSLPVGAAWRGVLLLGATGPERRDLGLRAVDAGCVLVADDHACVWASGGALYAQATDTADDARRSMTRLYLAALIQDETAPRAPQGEITTILGLSLPTLRVHPREESGVSRLLARLRAG